VARLGFLFIVAGIGVKNREGLAQYNALLTAGHLARLSSFRCHRLLNAWTPLTPCLASFPAIRIPRAGSWERLQIEPFNGIALGIFALAILHTFSAARFTHYSHEVQRRHDDRLRHAGKPGMPSVTAEILHFLGEVEVVFGLWAVVVLVALALYGGWDVAVHYFDEGVTYKEPLFVVVIMTLAATRPIVGLAESWMRRFANVGGGTCTAWWLSILTIGPILGSFITEPAAMTISALLLGRQFYAFKPGPRLKYATLGLLFVNVSIGGTLTHFAAPPVLIVARTWEWDLAFMFVRFGWRAMVAIGVATLVYWLLFRSELRALDHRKVRGIDDDGLDQAGNGLPVPVWLTAVHVGFVVWTVVTAHHPSFFLGGFLIFLGFAQATSVYQSLIELRGPLLVGFFLAGLVIHGGLQGWWIAPVLASLGEFPLVLSATILTAFNDNALITYLATLVPTFDESLKTAVVQGAVTGGGLTVIANAPNPAGQALLGRFFGGAVSPVGLFLGALVPTVIAAAAFRLL